MFETSIGKTLKDASLDWKFSSNKYYQQNTIWCMSFIKFNYGLVSFDITNTKGLSHKNNNKYASLLYLFTKDLSKDGRIYFLQKSSMNIYSEQKSTTTQTLMEETSSISKGQPIIMSSNWSVIVFVSMIIKTHGREMFLPILIMMLKSSKCRKRQCLC